MAPTISVSLFDSNGNKINLGKKIGSGGEGDVFEISSPFQSFVAKIYHKPLDSQKQEKLKLMVQGCNDELKAISAWPVDLIYIGQKGKICGFLMVRVTDYKPIHMLYGPSHRKQLFPEANWQFLIRSAKNVAASFYVIHKYGCVIGDVNEGNILVNKQGCIKLIDCDSFQVRGNNNIKYYCEVGVAQFTPPEIQNAKNFKMERIPNHDNFGLAILIFQLLFMGRHPFSGVFHGKGDLPIEKAIAEYRFAFSKASHLKLISPPPNSVDLAIVPADIEASFEQAFTEKGIQYPYRPTARNWWKLLHDFENKLKQCDMESMHKFYAGLSSCPWCKLESTSGILLFLGTITKFDLNVVWQKIESIKPPGPLPNISPKNFNFESTPISNDLQKAILNRKIRQISGVVIIIFGFLINIWLILLAIPIAILLFFYPGRETEEKKRRKKLFETNRINWNTLSTKWKSEAGDQEFKIQLSKLAILKKNYENIEKEYKNAQISLQNTVREQQLKKYLENCFIDSYHIPQVGANRKATLRSFGIETAADISYAKIRNLPGFGDVLTSELVSWRQQMEYTFRFDPSKGIDKHDIQILQQKFHSRMRPLERQMQTGIENLNQIQQRIFKNRGDLFSIVERSAKELAQSHADLKPFQII